MYCKIPVRCRIIRALFGEQTLLNIILGMLATLTSLGFVISKYHGDSTLLLDSLTNYYSWAVMFAVYGGVKVICTLYRTNVVFKYSVSIFGMWLWTYILLSSLFLDPSPIHPIELMAMMPLICEFWSLTTLIYSTRHTIFRRFQDAV